MVKGGGGNGCASCILCILAVDIRAFESVSIERARRSFVLLYFFFFHFVRLRFTRWSPWHCFVSTKAIIIIILTENRRQRTTTLTAAMRVNECCYYCYSLFFQKESAVLCRRVHNDRSERKKKKFFVFFFEIFTAAFIERDFGPPNMHWYVERTVAEQFIIVVDTRYVSTSVHTTVG